MAGKINVLDEIEDTITALKFELDMPTIENFTE